MFWEAVVGGLKILSYWQTYVAAFVYCLIAVLPMVLFGLIAEKNEAIGCISMMIVGPILQAFATIIFIFTMSPLLLGISTDIDWSFPWIMIANNTIPMIITVITILVISIVLTFVTIIGRINSLQVLISSGICINIIVGMIDKVNPKLGINNIETIPGFWVAVGILLIGGFLSWVSTMVSALLLTLFGERSEEMGLIIAPPIGALFGFMPVFIYCSWIGKQIIKLIP